MAGERLERRMPAQPHAVAQLRRDVVTYAEQLGATDAACRAVAHAVSEALTNAVVHGPTEGAAELTLEAWDDEAGHLLVRVSDEGPGMYPRPDHPGLGIGLNLMAQLADDVRLRDQPDRPGTTVSMRFALDGSETALPAPVKGEPAPLAAFEIREQRREGVRTVSPRGELDLSKAQQLEQRLVEIGHVAEPTVLDLSGLSFIDSSGITVLVRTKQWADKHGWPLDMRDPSPQVRRVMELTRVAELLGV